MIQWHTGAERVRRLAFSGDGRLLASASYRATGVQLWRPDGMLVNRLSFGQSVRAFALSPDGRTVAAGVWRQPVIVCDAATRREVGRLAVRVWDALAYSPDGAALAAATGYGVAWCDPATGGVQPFDSAFPLGATSLAFAPDGRRLVTNGSHGPCVLDVRHTRVVRRLPQPPVGWSHTSVAVSPDGRRVATSRRVWDISLWSLDSPDRPTRLPGLARSRAVRGLAFTADGASVLAVGSDGLVRRWDAATGGERQAWDFGLKNLQSLAVAPDGLTAAVGSHDGRICVWDL